MCYLLKFYSLGTKITKKYRNLSTIITEQINLYLHMEQKPQKKEELLVANAVSYTFDEYSAIVCKKNNEWWEDKCSVFARTLHLSSHRFFSIKLIKWVFCF